MNRCACALMRDERGVSPIVATVLIMLIALVLAAFISDELRVWISEIFAKLNSNNIDVPIK